MSEKVKDSLNRCDPNTLTDIFRSLRLGSVFSGFRRTIRMQVPVNHIITLPNSMKAKRILSVYSRAGGEVGPFTVDTSVPPATKKAGITTTGDIAFLAADAVTLADVEYEPVMNVEEHTLKGFRVASDALVLPSSATPAVMLLSVVGYNAAGTAIPMTIAAPAAANGGAGTANLNFALTQILFNAGNAVVRADVTMLVEGTDIGIPLEMPSTFI